MIKANTHYIGEDFLIYDHVRNKDGLRGYIAINNFDFFF